MGGTCAYELPLAAPQYREDDNLRPLAETVVRLPAEVAQASSLSGIYTVAGLPGEEVSFRLTELADYLEPNAFRELRLVLTGPDSLARSLATGHYEHDIQLTAEIGGKTVARTLRGTTAVVNRADAELGDSRMGQALDLGRT